MTSTKADIERIALVIEQSLLDAGVIVTNGRAVARAAYLEALRAIREPTPRMVRKGVNARPTKNEIEEHGNVFALYRAIHQAMIDQRIKEVESDDHS